MHRKLLYEREGQLLLFASFRISFVHTLLFYGVHMKVSKNRCWQLSSRITSEVIGCFLCVVIHSGFLVFCSRMCHFLSKVAAFILNKELVFGSCMVPLFWKPVVGSNWHKKWMSVTQTLPPLEQRDESEFSSGYCFSSFTRSVGLFQLRFADFFDG